MKSLNDEFNQQKGLSPYSIRFTDEEREELGKLAKGQPWARYIKDVLFREKRRPKIIEIDRKGLGRLIGVLGRSRIATNINQLAKAANSGSLPVDDETRKALNQACRTVEWMRLSLLDILRNQNNPSAPLPLDMPNEAAKGGFDDT